MNTIRMMREGLSPLTATLLLVFSVNLATAPTAAAQSDPIAGNHITTDGSVEGFWGVNFASGDPPLQALHVKGDHPQILLEDTSGGFGANWTIGSQPSGELRFEYTSNGTTPFRISAGVGTNALVVAPPSAIPGGPGNIGIGTGNPLAALHVSGLNAQILVTEGLFPPVAARNMFQLINNGPIGFNMTDSNAAQTWRFAAQTTGFRVSLDGTGGPEMEVGTGGTLQVGPGGIANLILDASGNLTITGQLMQTSDRAAKTNIISLDTPEVLTKLAALPVSQWAYKNTPSVNHIGPMAQDFKAAFGLGADDTHLAPGDLAGVAVVGVQALHRSVQELRGELQVRDEKIAAQDAKLAERDAEFAALKERLAVLEGFVSRIVAQQTAQTAQR